MLLHFFFSREPFILIFLIRKRRQHEYASRLMCITWILIGKIFKFDFPIFFGAGN